MTRPQFVQSLYYVNCLGQRIDGMQTIERVFDKYVDELSMEELAIVAWTFDLQDHRPNQRQLKLKCFDRLDQLDLGQLDGVFLSKLMPVSGWRLSSWAQVLRGRLVRLFASRAN